MLLFLLIGFCLSAALLCVLISLSVSEETSVLFFFQLESTTTHIIICYLVWNLAYFFQILADVDIEAHLDVRIDASTTLLICNNFIVDVFRDGEFDMFFRIIVFPAVQKFEVYSYVLFLQNQPFPLAFNRGTRTNGSVV